jgi:hypothetical protein
MEKFKVVAYRDSLGNRRGWTVVALPNDYRQGDPAPTPHLSDRCFETEEEAAAELRRRTADTAGE